MAFDLVVLPFDLAVCHLAPGSRLPAWLADGSWQSVTRTTDEVSIVCPAQSVPQGVDSQGPFAAFRVRGTLGFSLVGVLATLLAPLAQAEIPVFVVSTYDTDYILVSKENVARASEALVQAGHSVEAAAAE